MKGWEQVEGRRGNLGGWAGIWAATRRVLCRRVSVAAGLAQTVEGGGI